VWAAEVDRARNALTRRIAEAIGGQAGAVGAALVTGKRGLIDEDTNDILRAAGIYHIVSFGRVSPQRELEKDRPTQVVSVEHDNGAVLPHRLHV
jgi:hypothetical protein